MWTAVIFMRRRAIFIQKNACSSFVLRVLLPLRHCQIRDWLGRGALRISIVKRSLPNILLLFPLMNMLSQSLGLFFQGCFCVGLDGRSLLHRFGGWVIGDH